MDRLRRIAVATVEVIYNLFFPNELDTDEIERGARRTRLAALCIENGTRKAFGFARGLLILGGPTYRIPGSVRVVDGQELFTPGLWWRDHGATECFVDHQSESGDLGEGAN